MNVNPNNHPAENKHVVFEYETYMLISLRYLLGLKFKTESAIERALTNALVESILLHIRILSDIFLSRDKSHADEISLSKIISNKQISPELNKLITELEKTYGKARTEGSPCWTINKMLAHASELRSSHYDYSKVIDQLFPLLLNIIKEMNKVLKNSKIEITLNFSNKVLLA